MSLNELPGPERTDARRGDTLCKLGWSAERIETLIKLWADGHSASHVAAELGGTTRNAVIAKVHRLGLSGRATTSRMKRRKADYKIARKKRWAPVPTRKAQSLAQVLFPIEALPKARETDIGRKTIDQLEDGDCRWPCKEIPAGSREQQMFCGDPKMPGLPYCIGHCRVAFQPLYKGQSFYNGTFVRDYPKDMTKAIDEIAERTDLQKETI